MEIALQKWNFLLTKHTYITGISKNCYAKGNKVLEQSGATKLKNVFSMRKTISILQGNKEQWQCCIS
jgi:hypothetical protein